MGVARDFLRQSTTTEAAASRQLTLKMPNFESVPVELPSEYVEASNGFALDIGSSTIKLIYRSNDDYEKGKPLKDELKNGKGRVYMVPSIPRTELDDALEFIRTKCDLIRLDDAKTEILTTGVGCNLFRPQIEEGLNVSLTNVMEIEVFVKAFYHRAMNTSKEELFYPVNQEATKMGQMKGTMYVQLRKQNMPDNHYLPENVDEPKDGSIFPCFIAMCGSAVGWIKVNADGSWMLHGASPQGGRTFLGIANCLTGFKDFGRIYEGIESGSHEDLDEFASEIAHANTGDKRKDDVYGHLRKSGMKETPGIYFGKAAYKEREEFKQDDMCRSLYRLWCITITEMANLYCRRAESPRLYFCGNFVENEKAREFISMEHQFRQEISGNRVQLQFIKQGGHLGTLGAFMKAKDVKEAK